MYLRRCPVLPRRSYIRPAPRQQRTARIRRRRPMLALPRRQAAYAPGVALGVWSRTWAGAHRRLEPWWHTDRQTCTPPSLLGLGGITGLQPEHGPRRVVADPLLAWRLFQRLVVFCTGTNSYPASARSIGCGCAQQMSGTPHPGLSVLISDIVTLPITCTTSGVSFTQAIGLVFGEKVPMSSSNP